MKQLAAILFVPGLLVACSGKPQIIQLQAPDKASAAVDKTGQMTVTGTATLQVSPNCADLTMTLTSEAPKPAAAASGVQGKEQALVAELAKVGIEAADIKLSYLTLEPFYDPPASQFAAPHLHGYRGSLTVTATTKAFSKIGAMMDAGADAGATSLTTQFRRSDLSDLKKKVREMALTAAREKAKQTATALDFQLGRITTVSESAGGMYNQTYFPQVANEMRTQPLPTGDTAVNLGAELQPLTLDITVGYELAHT
jgi:uncharacterized protein YggE